MVRGGIKTKGFENAWQWVWNMCQNTRKKDRPIFKSHPELFFFGPIFIFETKFWFNCQKAFYSKITILYSLHLQQDKIWFEFDLSVQICNYEFNFFIKGLDHLAHGRGILANFWVPHHIESCNLKNLLDLWFREASQNWAHLENFFPHSFQGGTKWKMLKNQCIVMANFQHFSFGPPLKTIKKSCLNKLRGFTKSKKKHMLKI